MTKEVTITILEGNFRRINRMVTAPFPIPLARVFLSLFWTTLLFGQEADIRGVVSDSLSGERLVSANVTVAGTNRGAVTNASGFYLLPQVPAGEIELMASCVGYLRQKRVLILRAGSTTTVDFRLSPRDVEVSEVVVQGSRFTDTSHLVTSLYAFAPKQLRQIPGPVQGDPFRAISILPGIVSTADVSSKFYVRGGAGDQNLILLDGMKIYNPYHAFGIFSVFDPAVIQSVDVYTGAFPAGYAGALSSVVNMTTRSGNGGRLSGGASLNFLSARARLEGPLGEGNSFLLSGQKSLSSRELSAFLQNPPPATFEDFFGKVTFGSPTGQFNLRGFGSTDEVRSPAIDQPDHIWRTQALSATFSNLISDWLYLDATASFSRSEVRRDAKSSTVVLPAQSLISEFGLRSELTVYSETRNLWLGGFEVSFPNTEYTFAPRGSPEQNIASLHPEFSAWLRREQTVGRLKADVGINIDVALLFDRGPELQTLQPRVTLTYEIAPDLRAKAAYGVFTQNIVTLSNEDDVVSLFEAWLYLPDQLRPEEAHHYVLGLEKEFSHSLAARIQSYYKDYRSIALYNRERVYPTDPDYVAGTGTAYGVESLLRLSGSSLDLYLAYTLGWARLRTDGFTYSPRYDRRHSINFLGVARPLRDLEVSIRWEFGTGYPFSQNTGYYDRLLLTDPGSSDAIFSTGVPYSTLGPKNAARLPDYHRLDLSVTYRFTVDPLHGSLGAYLINLYDRKNIFYYDRKTGETVAMISFFPSATLTLEF